MLFHVIMDISNGCLEDARVPDNAIDEWREIRHLYSGNVQIKPNKWIEKVTCEEVVLTSSRTGPRGNSSEESTGYLPRNTWPAWQETHCKGENIFGSFLTRKLTYKHEAFYKKWIYIVLNGHKNCNYISIILFFFNTLLLTCWAWINTSTCQNLF